MPLDRIQMIRKIHNLEISVANHTGNQSTQTVDITSLGIIDYNKCEIINSGDNSQYNYSHPSGFRLVSNTSLEYTHSQNGAGAVKPIQIKEYY
jgi:hypothetical protein